MRWFFIALAALAPAGSAAAQLIDQRTAGSMTAAIAAADQEVTIWFNLIKDDEPRIAWERGSQYFKQRINRETFVATWSRAGRGLEPILKRRLTAVRYVPLDAPRYPEAVVFDTRVDFRGGTQGGETITVARGDDGTWRVWEYLVSPTLRATDPGFSRPP